VKIAIYGKKFDDEFVPAIQRLVDYLSRNDITLLVYEKFFGLLSSKLKLPDGIKIFSDYRGISGSNALVSIGGDGTLLDTVRIVRDSNIPILGINTGRLGFLSHVSIDGIEEALDALISGNYKLYKRKL